MAASEVSDPRLVMGHSFGGGIGIRLAHDFPGVVRYLVLLDSVGAGAWKGPRRPDWRGALRAPPPLGEAGGGLRPRLRGTARDPLPRPRSELRPPRVPP